MNYEGQLKNLPTSLEILNLRMCDFMGALPNNNLRDLVRLRELNLCGMDELTEIPTDALPPNLEDLDCSEMQSLERMPDVLPPRLRALRFNAMCPGEVKMPSAFPCTLKMMMLSHEAYVNNRPALPPGTVLVTSHNDRRALPECAHIDQPTDRPTASFRDNN